MVINLHTVMLVWYVHCIIITSVYSYSYPLFMQTFHNKGAWCFDGYSLAKIIS